MSLSICPTTIDPGTITAERRLFLGVIVNAVRDASGQSINCQSRGKDERAARRWFNDAGEDFNYVCHLAGLEPDNVRSAVLDYLEQGATKFLRGSRGKRLVH